MPATGYRLRVVVKDCETKSICLWNSGLMSATLGEHSRMSVLFQSSTSLLSEGSGEDLQEGGEYEGVIGRRSAPASIGSRISNRGSPYSLSESKHSLGSVQSSPKRSRACTRRLQLSLMSPEEKIEDIIRLGDVILEDVRGHFRVELRAAIESV